MDVVFSMLFTEKKEICIISAREENAVPPVVGVIVAGETGAGADKRADACVVFSFDDFARRRCRRSKKDAPDSDKRRIGYSFPFSFCPRVSSSSCIMHNGFPRSSDTLF